MRCPTSSLPVRGFGVLLLLAVYALILGFAYWRREMGKNEHDIEMKMDGAATTGARRLRAL
eukprot:1091990-Alexandrium_andersonii.AAC.1